MHGWFECFLHACAACLFAECICVCVCACMIGYFVCLCFVDCMCIIWFDCVFQIWMFVVWYLLYACIACLLHVQYVYLHGWFAYLLYAHGCGLHDWLLHICRVHVCLLHVWCLYLHGMADLQISCMCVCMCDFWIVCLCFLFHVCDLHDWVLGLADCCIMCCLFVKRTMCFVFAWLYLAVFVACMWVWFASLICFIFTVCCMHAFHVVVYLHGWIAGVSVPSYSLK